MFRTLVLGLALAGIGLGSSAALAEADRDFPALQAMHADFVKAFVDSEGFGKRRILPMMAQMRRYRFDTVGDSGQCVYEVQLIGIARHDPPVAYASRLMGFQHSDGDSALPMAPPGRGLSSSERQALEVLAEGQALVVQKEAQGKRVIGPIRAQPECLACHKDKQEGDLLGALSYGMGRLEMPQGNPERRFCRR